MGTIKCKRVPQAELEEDRRGNHILEQCVYILPVESSFDSPRTYQHKVYPVFIMSANSGVTVSQDCIQVYEKLKLHHNAEVGGGGGGDEKSVNVVHVEPASTKSPLEKYEVFKGKLDPSECKYAVLDMEFDKQDAATAAGSRKQNKLVFVSYIPETAKVKSKMLYASTKETVSRTLTGLAVKVQATDEDEIAYDNIMQQAKS